LQEEYPRATTIGPKVPLLRLFCPNWTGTTPVLLNQNKEENEVSAKILEGGPIADQIKDDIRTEIEQMVRPPQLMAVMVYVCQDAGQVLRGGRHRL